MLLRAEIVKLLFYANSQGEKRALIAAKVDLLCQSCCPIHQQRERTDSDSRFSQGVHQQTTVGRDIVAGAEEQGLTDGGMEKRLWGTGLDGALVDGDGKLQDVIAIDSNQRITIGAPTRGICAARGDLPPGAGSGKRGDVDFVAAGLARGVGDPVAVG